MDLGRHPSVGVARAHRDHLRDHRPADGPSDLDSQERLVATLQEMSKLTAKMAATVAGGRPAGAAAAHDP